MTSPETGERTDQDMGYLDHMRQFLDESVDEQELRTLALSAIAGSVRRLKQSIAVSVWEARQLAAAQDAGAAAHLDRARRLKDSYDAAMDEYRQIRSLTAVSTGREEN
ncbi:MAG: hypothetical protein WD208_03145 [Dehalococcoidia bacterium]